MTAPDAPHIAPTQLIDPAVLRGIRQASQATSTDFGLLMAQAAQESSFRANAKSTTSSAAGLFQFVDSTWLDLVRRFGDRYGAGQLAHAIGEDSGGKAVVSDPATRRQILALRDDPALSAALAGEYTRLNKSEVEQALGHKVQRADLYMAHFLGASGASAFLKAVETKGDMVAADLLPEAAAANRSVFYDAQTGKPRTVADIYRALSGKIEQEASEFAKAAGSGAASSTSTIRVANAKPSLPDAATAFGSGSGHIVNWSGFKLSAPTLAMLDIVTFAALKMTSKDANTPYAPTAPPQPREHRSL